MHFDLISDLHNDYWPQENHIKWAGLGTSLVAVVAGDVSKDWQATFEYLMEMSKHYKHVVFIDGNHEHNMAFHMNSNADILHTKLQNVSNITYLHRNSIILDRTAFVGCNGWWTFDFAEPEINREQAWLALRESGYSESYLAEILLTAKQDAQTIINVVKVFTFDPNIDNIVVVTHTAPVKNFRYIQPNQPKYHYARAGNSLLRDCLNYDVNKKIKVWCFGHCHHEIDNVIDNVRYVCHPRGMPEEGKIIYYPKLIGL